MIEYKSGVTVEHLGGTKVRFTCPRGHKTTSDFSKGPIPKRMGVAGVTKMIPYWNDRVTYNCRKCSKEENGGQR